MASKKFFFNSTLLRYDLRRFWPCWAAILLVAVLLLPVAMANMLADDLAYGLPITIETTARIVVNCLPVVLMAAMGMGLVVAVLVSRYLFTARSVNFYHSLPLRREGLLLTNVVTGLVMLWAPVLVTAVITAIVELSFGVFDAVTLGQLLLVYLCASLLFFAMALLCCHVTGMTAAAIGLYVVINCVFYVGYAICAALMETFMVGYSTSATGLKTIIFLTPIVNLWTKCGAHYVEYHAGEYTLARLSNLGVPLLYAAVGIALLGVVVLLCRHRKSERAGDLLAFGWLRPVFKVVFALGIGAALCLLTLDMYDLYDYGFWIVVVLLVIWSLVAWMIAEMLVRKSLKVFQRRVFVQWSLAALCAVLFLGGMRMDVFGVERRVPDAGEVASVQVSVDGRYANLQDPQTAIDLHQVLVEHREELRDTEEDASFTSIRIAYTLTNGSSMERYYRVPDARNEAEMNELQRVAYDFLRDPDNVLQFYFDGALTWKTELKQTSVEYYDDDRGYYDALPLTSDEAWQLYQAVEADIREGNLNYTLSLNQEAYEKQYAEDWIEVRIEFSYLHRETEEQQRLQSRNGPGVVGWQWVNIDVNREMTNTVACLQELGWKP